MQRKKISIEIGVVILFILFGTFTMLLLESYLFTFNEGIDCIDRELFTKILKVSFMRSLLTCGGLSVLYFINKNRIHKGKKPL